LTRAAALALTGALAALSVLRGLAMDAGAAPNDIDTRILLLDSPLGGGPHDRERARAGDWLLAHPEQAYPRLRARVARGEAQAGAIETLARFDRAESVAPLAVLLAADGPQALAAAQALALQTQPAAASALREALARPSADLKVIAADALGQTGDPSNAPALEAELTSPDSRVRYSVLQALGRLEGPSPRLAAIARQDANEDVRSLAEALERPARSGN
jgi:hypothetical protein